MPQFRTYQVFENLTIAAGGEETINVTGEFFTILASSLLNFEIGFDEGPLNFAKSGHAGRLPPGDVFSSVRFKNTDGANSLVLTFAAGFGDLVDNETTISGAITLNVPVGLSSAADVSLGAAAKTLILAANISRVEALITNLAANASTVRIGDVNAAAARGVELAPGQTITLETEGAIYAWNPGAAQSVGVIEVTG